MEENAERTQKKCFKKKKDIVAQKFAIIATLCGVKVDTHNAISFLSSWRTLSPAPLFMIRDEKPATFPKW